MLKVLTSATFKMPQIKLKVKNSPVCGTGRWHPLVPRQMFAVAFTEVWGRIKQYFICSDLCNTVVITKLLIKYLCCWYKVFSVKMEWGRCYLAVLSNLLKYKYIVILVSGKYPVQITKVLGVENVVHVNRLCKCDLYVSLNYCSGYHWGVGR